jgi:hypothetical protein
MSSLTFETAFTKGRFLPVYLKAPRAVLQRSGRLILTDDGRSASHSAVMMTPSNQPSTTFTMRS